MRRAKVVYDEVRAAQELLGTGQVDEALEAASSLRSEAAALVARSATLTSFERAHAAGAFTYATVTLVLGIAEKDPPQVAIPQIRTLCTEACKSRNSKEETWKVLAAAAEMLARSGDAAGACWAAKKAKALTGESDYLMRMAGGIQSMYPQVFAATPEDPDDEPPEMPARGRSDLPL